MSGARRARVPGRLGGWPWVLPFLIGGALFLALPAAMSVYYGFTDYSLLEPPVWIGLENLRELARDPVFAIAVRNTVVYAAIWVVGSTVLALALAALVRPDDRLSRAVRAIVFVPVLLPLVAAAMAWTSLYGARDGLINAWLARLGIAGPDWLGDARFALSALLVMGAWAIGGQVVVYVAALNEIPRPLLEAASIDGARPWSRFRHVVLPLLAPAMLFNVVTATIWSLQVFAVPYMTTRGGPDNATLFYTHYLYDNAFAYGRMGYASAMAWLQFVGIAAVTGLFLLASRRWVAAAGGGGAR